MSAQEAKAWPRAKCIPPKPLARSGYYVKNNVGANRENSIVFKWERRKGAGGKGRDEGRVGRKDLATILKMGMSEGWMW